MGHNLWWYGCICEIQSNNYLCVCAPFSPLQGWDGLNHPRTWLLSGKKKSSILNINLVEGIFYCDAPMREGCYFPHKLMKNSSRQWYTILQWHFASTGHREKSQGLLRSVFLFPKSCRREVRLRGSTDLLWVLRLLTELTPAGNRGGQHGGRLVGVKGWR